MIFSTIKGGQFLFAFKKVDGLINVRSQQAAINLIKSPAKFKQTEREPEKYLQKYLEKYLYDKQGSMQYWIYGTRYFTNS